MTPARLRTIEEIYRTALDQEPDQISAFLETACEGDEVLRRKVEALLASRQRAASFIETSAVGLATKIIQNGQADSLVGETIGHYKICESIGAGGMGDVYLATDMTAGRKAALKLLPERFTGDAERLKRFQQEARAVVGLNHPNILTIYEIGEDHSSHYIASELIEGETLRQRLTRRPMQLSEAVDVALQVASALAAAHQAGIVHRDIKPENLMLRPDGYVKVLDFGLAKLAEQTPSDVAAEAPTRQVRTGSGIVLGTAGYMSPEQARGKIVDARSDIFSLGAVIYEMTTQRKPFDGETPSDILAAILKTDPPPISHFAPDTPPELTRIVAKTLRKDREERFQVVKDLLLDLKSLAQDLEFHQRLKQASAPGEAAKPAGSEEKPIRAIDAAVRTDAVAGSPTTVSKTGLSSMVKPRRWPTLALAALILIGGSFGLYKLLNRNLARNDAVVPPVVGNIARITVWSGLDTQPTLSPDGNSVAYSSNHNGSFEIYIKQLTAGGREIQLTSDGQENFQPAWSADGRQIAYYSKNRGGIWLLPALGGTPKQ